ncbi:uncharacterized protein KIAA1143 homolog [Echeneis naucrates]|uniref:DUF4604 domain-containing protein n=1 Tax=Echeneis naucrates TaxID=173247 RepID=A0A665WSG3_ECHNA|nr:uncharacterized protein KIAA1143 homolog [Echeneis naucrates]
MNRNKASGVSWVKPAEPSFLKKFKNDVGYKEGPTIDTKHNVMPKLEDDSGSDLEDELPQVVVLKGEDLSAEEVKNIKVKMRTGNSTEKDDGLPPDKILFRKPAKRSPSEKFWLTTNPSKKKKSDEEKEVEKKKELKPGKKIKNNSLLSFGGDEVNEED